MCTVTTCEHFLWLSLVLMLSCINGATSQRWYTFQNLTEEESSFTVTKSGEIGLNVINIFVPQGLVVYVEFQTLYTNCYESAAIPDNCECVKFEVYDGPTVNEPALLVRACYGYNKPGVLISSSNSMLIQFTGKQGQGRGNTTYISAKYRSMNTPSVNTFQNFTVTEGRFSLSRMGKIGTNVINIFVPQGHVVQVVFETLNTNCYEYNIIPGYNYCDCIKMEIYDGPTVKESTLLRRACGNDFTPRLWMSSSNSMLIQFTGKQGQRVGNTTYFTAIYKSVNSSSAHRDCGGKFSDLEGSILYPGFPNNYLDFTVCEWIIIVPSGLRIQIVIEDLDIESSSDCAYDSLEIFYTTTFNGPGYGPYCTTFSTTSYQHIVEYESALVRFTSNWNRTGKGFRARWTAGNTYIHFTKPSSSLIYPGYCYKGLCVWNITVANGNLVKLSLNNVYMYCYNYFPNDPCACSRMEIYDGISTNNESLIARLCYSEGYWPDLVSSTNNMVVVLKNYNELLSISFSVFYSSVNVSDVCKNFSYNSDGILQSPLYPADYPNNTDCSFNVNIFYPGYQLSISFLEMNLQEPTNGVCKNDYLEIRSSTAVKYYCGSSLPTDLITASSTTLKFHSDSSVTKPGFKLKYKAPRECGGQIAKQEGNISSPRYPEKHPNIITCTWTLMVQPQQVINLFFSVISLGSNYGTYVDGATCLNEKVTYIQVFDGSSIDTGTLIGTYCGWTLPVPIISTNNSLVARFTSFYNIYSGNGFLAYFAGLEQSSVFRDCGGSLNASAGSITSPNHPSNYPSYSDCVWRITGLPGFPIKVSFQYFNLESSSSCQKDSLEIRNGLDINAPFLGRLCDTALPSDVQSTSNMMTIRFYSDKVNAFRGFQLTWASVCRNVYSGSSGLFYSPSNLNVIKTSFKCVYVIQKYNAYIVRLTFQTFLLGNSTSCETNYIEIRDGENEGSPLIGGRLCGNTLPPTITGTQSAMWILFATNGSSSNQGFTAYFTRLQACGSTTLTDKQGNFTSPFYPANYPLSIQCTWTVTTDVDRVIKLSFVDFLLEGPSGYCPYDFVQVYDGNTLIGTFCSVTYTPSITTTRNVLKVVFKSDATIAFPGFKATYITYDPLSDNVFRQYDLYPFGVVNGDTVFGDKDADTVHIITDGFPVANTVQKDIYIANKGLVTFGQEDVGKDFELKRSRLMICPYNTDIAARGVDGGVFYQIHKTNQTIISKASAEIREFASQENFTANFVLIVTWHRIVHRNSKNPSVERATVQMTLISDGVQSFALVYYFTGSMKWSVVKGERLTIGMAKGNPSEAQESMYSNTDQAFTSMGSIIGNTGREGMWIYKVGYADTAKAQQRCLEWVRRNKEFVDERENGFLRLPQCPCNLQLLRGNWVWSHWQNNFTAQCYRLSLGVSYLLSPYGKECCYAWDRTNWQSLGQFVSTGPDAGSATAFNPEFQIREYQLEDRAGHDDCCYKSSNPVNCNMYYKYRPIGNCTTRIPFRFSFIWGDPHIKTLDGGVYTFNGWGEYTMVSVRSPNLTFTLQGRTGLAETDNGTLTNATVFKAFGAEENGLRAFVALDTNTNKTLIIYVDGVDYTLRFYENNMFVVDHVRFLLKRVNDSVVIVFPSDTEIGISVNFKALEISLSMPLTFQNQTKGLLGNFNGVITDDFELPNGTTLNSNLTDREIFCLFGQEWTVTKTNTVMRYGPREGPENYTHPEFTPIFLDEQPLASRKAAEDFCGATNIACIYDFVATASTAIAGATKNTSEVTTILESKSKNTVPLLHFNSTFNLNSEDTLNFDLQGYDPDVGDILTYYTLQDSTDAVKLNSQTGAVSLKMNVSKPFSLSFYALDSQNVSSPIRDLNIVLCSGCHGHGVCDFSRTVSSAVSTNVEIATCVCNPAWTGPHCADDYDACAKSPCSAHQECVDLTPSEEALHNVSFNCSACSHGYIVDSNDPSRCSDVNECASAVNNNCSMNCENLPGTYLCTCDIGYRLKIDGFSCEDINECAEHTHTCPQICNNTVGSFRCECVQGYTMSQGVCQPDSTTTSVCGGASCEQGCNAQTFGNGSTVPVCFCRSGYTPDPSNSKLCIDKDECTEGVCSQSCINTVGSFACTCYPGYQLSSDQRTCQPCESFRYGPECRLTCNCNGKGVRCDPVKGCVCQNGWTGSQCETDIDECSANPEACLTGQLCKNTNGSFTCSCPLGYVKDADGGCIDIDECPIGSSLNTCGQDELCVNVPGTFYCTCKTGYKRVNNTCSDIDECYNNAAVCQHQCVNVQGSYNCECYFGYRLNSDRATCTKVYDACGNLNCTHGCGPSSSDPLIGACICNLGFQLADDLRTCIDIDECNGTTARCSHICINTAGGFVCSCPAGMKLDNDKITCMDCPDGTYGLNCSNTCGCGLGGASCNARTGCICLSGWTGEKCDRDVNECDTTAAQEECRNKSADCVNFQGGYSCLCRLGFRVNNNGTCQDINECASNPCDQICENSPGSYRCLCQRGFSYNMTSGRCEDINECALLGTHTCTQHCDNFAGSYRCSCDVAGYVLANDGTTCVATGTCMRTNCSSINGGCSNEQCFCNSGYYLNTTLNTCDLIDVDWCASDNCEQHCNETFDGKSFVCSCSPGYLLNNDKRTCRECPADTYGPGCNATCTCNTQNTASCNTINGSCTCNAGWKGVSCDDDIDECLTSLTNPCTAHAQCKNINGGYLCPCAKGYIKIQDNTCQECPTNTFGQECTQTCNCSINTQVCDNINGTCKCKAGWEGTQCEVDINECTTRQHNCTGEHVNCTNTNGSYRCDCLAGYVLINNGSCIECPANKYGKDCAYNCSCSINAKSCDNVNGTCKCNAGWEGSLCDVDINECTTGLHNCNDSSGPCVNTNGSYRCDCRAGFALNEVNVCTKCPPNYYGNNCNHTCNCSSNTQICDNVNGTCKCKAGWEGIQCEIGIDECTGGQHNCTGDHVSCSNTNGSYRCDCLAGYVFSKNGSCTECPPNYYGNNCNHTCNCSSNTDVCDNVNGTCDCKAGWEGMQCEIDIDECTRGLFNCTGDHVNCINSNGSYRCDCLAGYVFINNGSCIECPANKYGKNCSHNCSCSINAKSCDNVNGTCKCNAGWEGSLCDVDINECTKGLHNCDDSSGPCVNTNGSYRCDCRAGFALNEVNVCSKCGTNFYGNNCNHTCNCSINTQVCDNVNGTCKCKAGWEGMQCEIDIDECTRGQYNCTGVHVNCTNMEGSYLCDCLAGFVVINNGSCIECPPDKYGKDCAYNCSCSINAKSCDNVNGTCKCNAGWEGSLCDVDINECTTGLYNCNDSNGFCVNTNGSYRCDCRAGYFMNGLNVCTGCPPSYYGNNCTQVCNCSSNTQACVNVNGTCKCKTGWEGKQCEVDINECTTGLHNCTGDHVNCTNTNGSYRCDCLAGYVFINNGSCTECPPNHYGENCTQTCNCSVNTQVCDNVHGTCKCKAGWEGMRCEVDINECTTRVHNCTGDHVNCTNTEGGYRCDCLVGFIYNNNGDCTVCPPNSYGNKCTQTCNCSNNTLVCDNVNGTCKCRTGWEGMQCETDTNECTTRLHNCTSDHALCINSNGSFRCDCQDGYLLDKNGFCIEITLLKFEMRINTSDIVDLNNKTEYDQLAYQVKSQLSPILMKEGNGIIGIEIISLRYGSLIIDAAVVVPETIKERSGANLTMSLRELSGTNLTIGNYTGIPILRVNNITVSKEMSDCELYTAFSLCAHTQECFTQDGILACRNVNTQSSDNSWKLIVGLSVGIPLAVILLLALVSYGFIRKQRHTEKLQKKETETIADDSYSHWKRIRREHSFELGMKPNLIAIGSSVTSTKDPSVISS